MKAPSTSWVLAAIPVLASVSLVATDAGPTTHGGTSSNPTVYVSARCSAAADLTVRLFDDPDNDVLDRKRVRLTGAAPNRSWVLQVRQTDGDSESIGTARGRTNDRGNWTLHDELSRGRNDLEFRAKRRDGQGQRCAIDIVAQVSPAS
jgi:hypothetical protein